MSDETKPAETTPPTTEQSENIRNAPAFKAVTDQLKQLSDTNAALQAKIDEAAASEEAKRKADEVAALEAKGDYEEALERLKAEHETQLAAHAAELTKRDLKAELIKAGLTNDLALVGAVAGYVEGDVTEYVTALKAANPTVFAEQGVSPAASAAQGGATGEGATTDWAETRRDINTGTAAKANAAQLRVAEYLKKNGEMPPGF